MISISTGSGRSYRYKGELPFSGFVSIEYLFRYTSSSKSLLPEITIICKIGIAVIPKKRILYLSGLIDLSDLLIVKN